MKYAKLGPQKAILQISESPISAINDETVVELPDDQAGIAQAGLGQRPRVFYFWDGENALTSDEFRTKQSADALTLQEAKDAKIAELEAARWDAEVAGITLPDGKEVSTDKETQAELAKALSIISTVNPTLEIDWKFPDGEVVHLDPTQIQEIAGAVFGHVQATRTAYKDKVALVESATTKDELNAITW